MKKFCSKAIALAIGCTLFTGCAVNEEAVATNKEGNAEGNVKIDVWHSMGGDRGGVFDQIVKDFNETVGKEKGIEAISVYQGDDVVEKLKTVAQANDTKNFPDVGQIFGSGIPTVYRMDQLVPIEEYITKDSSQIKKEDIIPNFSRAFTYQDKMIGMPFNTSTILLYYNKDMFKEVGLDPDVPPTTIAEMAEYTEKLMQSDGKNVDRYGLCVELRRYQMMNLLGGMGEYNFIGDNEGGRTNPMTKVTFGEDGTLEIFLTEWEKLVQTGGYKHIEDNMNEEFATELFGMAIMSSARIAPITNLSKDNFEFGVAPLPKVSASDKGGASVGGGSLCLFDRGDEAKKDAAWEFIQYCVKPEVQYKWAVGTGYIPVTSKVYNLPEMNQFLDENPAYKVAIEQLNNSHVNVQEPFDLIPWELDDIMRSTMIDFAEGKLSIVEAKDKIVNECNKKLEAYQKANQ